MKKLAPSEKSVVQSSVEDFHTEEEIRLRAILASSPDAITVADLNGNIIDCNQAALDLFEFSSKEELIGKSGFPFIAEKDHQRAMEDLMKTLEQGSVKNIQYTCLTRDGYEFLAELSASVIKDSSGKPTGFVAITKDITERKKMEEELKKSEMRYRSLVENTATGIITVDPEGKFVFVNEAICKMMGYFEKELLGKYFINFVHPDDQERILQTFWNTLKYPNRKPRFEFRAIHKKGHIIHMFSTPTLFKYKNKIVGSHAIITDITDRRNAEETLLETEERLRSLVESAEDIIVVQDLEGKYLYYNAAPRYGLEDSDLLGKTPFDFFDPVTATKMMDRIKQVASSGQSLTEESQLVWKGETLWFNDLLYPIKDAAGHITAVGTISRNITEQKWLEEALRESEEKYRTQFEEALDAIFVADAETGITVDCNRAASELVGREKSELVGEHQRILHPPEEIEVEFSRTFKQHLKEKEGQVLETQVITKNGEIKDVAIKANAFKLRGKKLIQGIFRDITERKKMEETLERQRDIAITLSGARNLSEALNRLFDTLLEIEEFDCAGFYLVDKETGALDMVVHRGLPDSFVEKVSHLEADSPYVKVIRDGKPIYQKTSNFPPNIREDLQSDGILSVAAIPIQYEGTVIGDLNLASHTHDEISTSTHHLLESVAAQIGENLVRAGMEEELRKSESKSRTLLGNLPQKIFFKDTNSVYVSCNENYARDLKIKSDEIRGKTDYDFHPKKLAEKYRADDKRIMEFGKTDDIEEEYIQDGQKVFVHTVKTPVKDENGNVVGILGIFWDITERKKTEEALRRSEEKYRDIVELAPDSIVTLDMKGVITSCNTAATRMTGYSKDEIVGKHFSKLGFLRARDIPRYLKLLSPAVRGKVPKSLEVNCIRKGGAPYLAEVCFGLLKEGGKTIGFQVIGRDIIERKRMEDELRRYSEHLEELVEERTRELEESQKRLIKSERLAAIGELATMVAHDLRNPLTSIRTAGYYLRHSCPSCEKPECKTMLEMCDIIEQETLFADNIINDLLDFATERLPQKKRQDISDLVEASLKTSNIPDNIKIKRTFVKRAISNVDGKQLQRVFLNLIKNAVQAMPNGGKLTAKTSETKDIIEIIFIDTGIGIPEENMSKIFTPLFTTKAKGIGMGLAICKRIVERHGGTIDVKSKVDRGTIFTIKIPKKGEENNP